MKYIVLVLCTFSLQASMLDFLEIKKAKEAYEKKDYKSAITHYEKLSKKDKSDIYFNLGDSYYKNDAYEKALESFEKVKDPTLEFSKLHNMGNCYTHLEKLAEAIGAYEKALEIQEDIDTKFNLELLKKKRDKQQKQQDQKDDDQKNKDQENKDKDSQEKQDQNQANENHKNKNQDQNGKEQQDKTQKNKDQEGNKDEKKEEESKRDKQEEQNMQAMQNKEMKSVPISDMEERKWQKRLQGRGVNTLMLPIETTQGVDDETTPW